MPSAKTAERTGGTNGTLAGQTISVTEAAELLNRSARWVQNLAKDGFILKESAGKYAVVDLIRGVLAYYESRLEKSTKTAVANKATEARTREIELRIAERKRDLIHQEDARAVVGQMAAMVKAEFSGLPARYTRDMTERRSLEQEIDASFERLAAAARAAETALAAGRFDMEAEPEA